MRVFDRLNIKAAPVETNPFKVGDILCAEWGYSMSLVDFYEVSKVTPSSVQLKHLQDKVINADEWVQSGKKIPVKGKYERDTDVDGKTFRVIIRKWDNKPIIKINSSIQAELWDGKPKTWNTYD